MNNPFHAYIEMIKDLFFRETEVSRSPAPGLFLVIHAILVMLVIGIIIEIINHTP